MDFTIGFATNTLISPPAISPLYLIRFTRGMLPVCTMIPIYPIDPRYPMNPIYPIDPSPTSMHFDFVFRQYTPHDPLGS